MAHRQLAEHGTHHAVEVAASRQVRKEGLIFRAYGIPVGPVHVRGIEIVAIDSPRLAEHLLPLFFRIDSNFDGPSF